MAKPAFRLPRDDQPFLDLFGSPRKGPATSLRFSGAQIDQIRRTIRGTPEVMVKVTGGGRGVGAVSAHLSYITQKGELDLETEEGLRLSKDGQKELLTGWHLELTAGQYRTPKVSGGRGNAVKLVHNIVLSMPAPTPADRVLAAAKVFAREKFGLKHRYAMALHTHQQHPHVHLVVKAEDEHGRRLHIDKAMLREWREDFAQMMREQGISANATPRAVRGQSKRSARDAQYRAQQRKSSYTLRERVKSIVRELSATGTVRDPARSKLKETRRAILAGWTGIADRLDAQGEVVLAADVRSFASRLPPALTDRERLAQQFIRYLKETARPEQGLDLVRERAAERTR